MSSINIDKIDLGYVIEDSKNTNDSRVINVDNNYVDFKNVSNSYKKLANIHCHTFFSILDGAGSIDDYVKLAKKYNQPAIAITDHGSVAGTFEFYNKCKKAGIKPLIGIEAYVNDNMGDF